VLTISNKHSIDVIKSKRKGSLNLPRKNSSQKENIIEKKKNPMVRHSKRNAINKYFLRYIDFLNSPCIIFYYDTVINNVFNLEKKMI
jgi:hypothetical protein